MMRCPNCRWWLIPLWNGYWSPRPGQVDRIDCGHCGWFRWRLTIGKSRKRRR